MDGIREQFTYTDLEKRKSVFNDLLAQLIRKEQLDKEELENRTIVKTQSDYAASQKEA